MSKLHVKRRTSQRVTRNVRTKAKLANSSLPRLSVFRSNKFLYAQIINPVDKKSQAGVKGKNPEEVGMLIAKKAKTLSIERVVFDRGPYKYHGRVKMLADKAREGGLKF